MTEWEQLLQRRPSEAPFHITMDANSINEVWDDIDTKLDKDEGWHIVGLEFVFEGIDPTIPVTNDGLVVNAMTLQLQRGRASELLLPAFDHNVIAHIGRTTVYTAAGLMQSEFDPIHRELNEFTRQQYLRVLFRTSADLTPISDPATQISGRVLYHIISAPDDGRTKIGIDIDEI